MSIGIMFVVVFMFIIVRFMIRDNSQSGRSKRNRHENISSSSYIVGSSYSYCDDSDGSDDSGDCGGDGGGDGGGGD